MFLLLLISRKVLIGGEINVSAMASNSVSGVPRLIRLIRSFKIQRIIALVALTQHSRKCSLVLDLVQESSEGFFFFFFFKVNPCVDVDAKWAVLTGCESEVVTQSLRSCVG